MSASDRLTAVILNWRTPDYTVRAARALIEDGIAPQRLVIVDNASGDGSLERFQQALPDCPLLAMGENVGFASANNAGAKFLPARDAYLFVNSDAFLHLPGSVARLLDALADPAVGLAVPRLRNPDLTLQPNVVPFHSPLPVLVRASGFSRYVPNQLQPLVATHWDHGNSREIRAANGAVVLARAATWEELDGFDEGLFMYVEDLDLFRRASRLGWRSRFVAEAEFVHLGGSSARQRWKDAQRAHRVARTEAEVMPRYMSRARAVLTIAVMAGGVAARALWYRIRRDRVAAEVQLGWLRGYLRRPERP